MVISWLPLVDLPFPIVALGGAILAFASNRQKPRALSKGLDLPQVQVIDADEKMANNLLPSMPEAQTTTRGRTIDDSREKCSKPQRAVSPSLPNLIGKRDRSISPKISPTASPKISPTASHRTPGQRKVAASPSRKHASTQVLSPKNRCSEQHEEAKSSDPQLPTFINSPVAKPEISFTIDYKD